MFQILVVEDQMRHQKIFADTLGSELGVSVTFAKSGEEALDVIAKERRPDLVVLDLDLPKMSGKDVLEHLKGSIRTRLIPVIVLTGSSSQLVEMELLEKGAEDYLEKGSHPDILVSRIRAQIRHKRAIDRLQQLAVDRDIFTAGVLANIGSARKTLNDQAELIKKSLAEDPVKNAGQILSAMKEMCDDASKLGQFANDVIQSVRDTQRTTKPMPLEINTYFNGVRAWNVAKLGFNNKLNLTCSDLSGTVEVDHDYFRIVTTNILQYMAERLGSDDLPLTVSIGVANPGEGLANKKDHEIELVFRDFGSTPEKEDLETLFEAKVQGAEGEEPPRFDLSLAVVGNLVRKLDGHIWAEPPSEGEGLAFHILLPLIKSQ